MRKIVFLALLGLLLWPSVSFSTTNAARVKTWTAEKLYSADLNTEFDNLVNYINNNIAFVTNITATAVQINQLANNRFNQASSFVSAVTDSANETMNVGFVYTNNGRAVIDSMQVDTLVSRTSGTLGGASFYFIPLTDLTTYLGTPAKRVRSFTGDTVRVQVAVGDTLSGNTISDSWTITPKTNSTGRIGSNGLRFQSMNADTLRHTVNFDSNDVKSSGVGNASLQVNIVDSTKIRPASISLSGANSLLRNWPVDKVVDAAGRGDATTIGTLSTNNQTVYVKAATYNENPTISGAGVRVFLEPGVVITGKVVISGSNCLLQGGGNATIINGGTTGHAMSITGVNNRVCDFTARTNAGGGNAYDAVNVGSLADSAVVQRIQIPMSDQHGVATAGDFTRIIDCNIKACDNDGIQVSLYDAFVYGNYVQNSSGTANINISNASDNRVENNFCNGGAIGINVSNGLSSSSNVIVGNTCQSASSRGIYIAGTNAKVNVVVGNTCRNNTTANITDSGTSSTVTANNTTNP